jgi:hypothetical protein
MARDLSGVEFEVLEAERLSPARREELFGLFQGAYRQANWAFLDRSLAQLRHVAIASSEGHPVGFALAETRRIDLPRLPAQLVTLAGICCIASEYRRRGLFGQLELLAAEEEGVSGEGRRLFCGRMAHPAALRAIARLPGAVPQPGRTPTPWQQEVGAAIADTYGVHDSTAAMRSSASAGHRTIRPDGAGSEQAGGIFVLASTREPEGRHADA